MNDSTIQAVTAVESREISESLDLAGVKRHVNLVQSIMDEVMKDKEHYGTIPGCGDKKVLFKSGAEKLCFTFQMVPTFVVTKTDLPNGHREYEVTTRLHTRSGVLVAEGVGCCSTMESKYRYRGGGYENTGQPLPREYWDLKKSANKADNERAVTLLGGKGFAPKKTDDGWFIFRSTGEKAEHPDIADTYNTVLKMAKKRSHVDATITATAASDIFTQDIDEEYEAAPSAKPAPAAAPQSAAEHTPARGNPALPPAKPVAAAAPAGPSFKDRYNTVCESIEQKMGMKAGAQFIDRIKAKHGGAAGTMEQKLAALNELEALARGDAVPVDADAEMVDEMAIEVGDEQ